MPIANALRKGGIVMTPAQLSDLWAQQQQGASGLNSTYGLADTPGTNEYGLVRTAFASTPVGIETNSYTVTFDNTGGGATADRRIIGDWAGKYVNANPLPTPSPGMTISGSFGTSSVSIATLDQVVEAWQVGKVQVLANNQDIYNSNTLKYVDTKPNGANPTVVPYNLASLLNAEQFNPTIQFVDTPLILDGNSALLISIPVGRIITLNIDIVAVGRGRQFKLLGSAS